MTTESDAFAAAQKPRTDVPRLHVFSINLSGQGRGSVVMLDGRDITHGVTSISIKASVDELTEVTLTMIAEVTGTVEQEVMPPKRKRVLRPIHVDRHPATPSG